ncbi:MAG: TIGR02147 family protein, partial [Bdellovibrionota bacterium]
MKSILLSARDVIEVLATEIEERRLRNASYSMRAFARDLGVSSSRLSDIMNRKRPLTDAAAKRLAEGLGYNAKETEMLVLFAQASDNRQESVRNEALVRRQALIRSFQQVNLSTEAFEAIADWHHFAILEMTHLGLGPKLTPEFA